MANRNKKGRFVKSGAITHAPRTKTRTVTKTKWRTRSASPMRRSRRSRRGSSGGGKINLLHVAAAAAVLGYATSANNGIKAVKDVAAKIPGSKTFGPAAAIGVGCLAVDRFVKPNKWLKLVGVAGVVLAASKVGDAGGKVSWVGDSEDITADVSGDDFDDDDED